MTAYYNDNEPYVVQWLRNLITAGLIAPGDVDERSIREVRADDLRGYTQCHFFAGIGGWSRALRLAEWPDERPVWTGSCPCQPFSVAGRQRGFADERHLWPEWLRLVRELEPPSLFGEQVANASAWLNLVRGDLEALEYAVGMVPIEAAGAGAEHFRDRYWFVAYRQQPGYLPATHTGIHRGEEGVGTWNVDAQRYCENHSYWPIPDGDYTFRRSNEPIGNYPSGFAPRRNESDCDVEERGDRLMVYAAFDRWGEGWTEHEFRSRGFTAAVAGVGDHQYVECPDGKWRRLPPPRVRWLGTRLPARVDRIRAFGNAIDPRPASAFIRAAIGCAPY